jgi:nucleotide-binding universal stress UspA family protein
MFTRILLPVDLTEKNDAALAAARQLLGAGGEVILLHVIETIADAPFEDMKDFYQRLEDKARSRLAVLADSFDSEEASVEQHITYGRRAREIVAFAGDKQVDLILMSSRPLDRDKPAAAWGSISHQVAILAECPVLLLK